MNILHLISSEGFYGAENMLVLLAHTLKQAGWNCLVGVFRDERSPHLEVAEQARARGLRVEEISCAGRIDWNTPQRIRQVYVKNKVDVLHTHGYKADIYGCAAVRALHRAALVATCHGQLGNRLRLRAYAAFDRVALRSFNRIAAVSEELATSLTAAGVRRITTIPNGVDLQRFATARPVLREQLGGVSAHLVGFVGRLDVGKGADVLIRAAPLVLREIPATTFLFVGEGPQRLTLEALANRFGVARNVVFAGVRRDMPEVYASLDVVTLPSRTEGMPMCLLEAMAASRPVIATPVGSIPKLIFPKQTGLLVAQDDPSDLAKKILHIASNPGQARVMAERARQHVGVHYSAESMATKYIRLYEEAATLLEGQAQRGGVHGEVCHR